MGTPTLQEFFNDLSKFLDKIEEDYSQNQGRERRKHSEPSMVIHDAKEKAGI